MDSSLFTSPSPATGKGVLRLVIVDDHAIVRDCIRLLLALEPDFEVVGVGDSAEVGIELAQRLAPDVVITDMMLGGRDGAYLVAEVIKSVPSTKVLVLSARIEPHYVKAALLAGARGYLSKDAHRSELVQAIRTVISEYYLLCAPTSEAVISTFLKCGHLMNGPWSTLLRGCTLSPREREIVALIALGKSNRLMGEKLQLSIKTIAKHRCNAMRKLNLRSTADITAFAYFNGYIPRTASVEHSLLN